MMILKIFFVVALMCQMTGMTYAQKYICQLPLSWTELCETLVSRVEQTNPKMKLSTKDAQDLERFLTATPHKFPHILKLQKQLLKTSLELLRSVRARGVMPEEAEKMAAYLTQLIHDSKFDNVGAFDTNTSHIIGREWDQIDYRGEGMTWQGQKAAYAPHGITDFKSAKNIAAFFKVESKLPYFKKKYYNKR